MIGVALELLGLGVPGDGLCGIILGVGLAICAVCGIYRCSHCRMRDCWCIKRCMRATGSDQFDDFDLTVLVHEAMFSSSKLKISTKVRITAGDHTVSTDSNTKGVYQQAMQIFIEQGTEEILVQLIDADSNKPLALTKLNIQKHVLDPKVRDNEKVFNMKQQSKTVLNPRVKLTMLVESGREGEMEQGLLQNVSISPEASMLLRQQMQKEKAAAPEAESGEDLSSGHASGYEKEKALPQEVSDIELLMKVCKGPLEMFGSWGTRSSIFVAVQGPPQQKKYTLGIWKSQADYEKDIAPKQEIEILKILSVLPDPSPKRTEIFVIQHVSGGKNGRLTLERVDRARDVWVEMLVVLIRTLREQKEERKRQKRA